MGLGLASQKGGYGGGKAIDIAGNRYGSLVALRLDGLRNHRAYWVCQCDCGATTVAMAQALKAGNSVTCGSAEHRSARLKGKGTTHGRTSSRAYTAWAGMRKRCLNVNDLAFSRYGGRGIQVCDRWSDFANFQADMGDCPDGMEIDRIDVNGHYEPHNCRWADLVTQANNKRNNRLVIEGERIETVAEYATRTGIGYATAYYRKVIRGSAPKRDDFLTNKHAHVMRVAPQLIWESDE